MRENFYISFAVWLCLLPFFGIPSTWKTGLMFASGVLLLLVNVGPIIFKNIQPKPKLRKRQSKVQNAPILSEFNIEMKRAVSRVEEKEDVHA